MGIVPGIGIFDCILYILSEKTTAQAYDLYHMYFQIREKRTLLLQKMVIGGKLLVMNCTVNKLLNSRVSIFLMLPRISGSLD